MKNTTDAIRRARLIVMVMALTMVARDAAAVERKGFIIGLGLGGGTMTCDGCKSASGLASEFHIGGMLTEKVALIADSSLVSRDEDGATLYSVVAGAAIQYWVSSRVWIKGGVGAGILQATIDQVTYTSDAGLGFLGGIGVEAVQKKKFAIDLQFRFTTASIEGSRTNNFFGLVGFNFY